MIYSCARNMIFRKYNVQLRAMPTALPPCCICVYFVHIARNIIVCSKSNCVLHYSADGVVLLGFFLVSLLSIARTC